MTWIPTGTSLNVSALSIEQKPLFHTIWSVYGLEKHLGGIQSLFFAPWIEDLSKVYCAEEYNAKSFLVEKFIFMVSWFIVNNNSEI